MTWNKLDTSIDEEKIKHEADKRRQEVSDLSKAYKRLFESKDGQRVMEDLFNKFIMTNDVSFDAKNPNYEAAYRNGESGVVKYITNRVSNAKDL